MSPAPTLADREVRDSGGTTEEDKFLPKIIEKMNEDQKQRLYQMVEKKAWIKATQVQPLTDEEETIVAKTEKKHGPRVAKEVRTRFYNKHHWDSLRWFLFGGLVDIPVQQDPRRAWDPKTNPFIKIRMPSFVFTQDEHDQVTPYKRLPDKKYLRLVAYAWIHEPLLALPKSRQLMMTWLFCAVGVHETLFREAKTTAWISKKFDDADAHLEKRVTAIADRLPRNNPNLYVPKYKNIKGIFECAESGSIIRAMGEEARGLRQYTFSWVFDDETGFQEQASDIITAALPTVNGGGRFTLVSSANGKEVFFKVVTDNKKIAVPPGP